MNRETFAERLEEAVARARVVAQSAVIEDLPEAVKLRLRLNSSYAGVKLRPDVVVFPDDDSYERARELRRCDLTTAADELWRDGRVPEWINIAAIDCDEHTTLVELVCCGRFTADDARLYKQNGPPPFAIHGVPLPPGQRQPDPRWSIHRRAECWDRDELANLHRIGNQVWSLELRTDAFDPDSLAALPGLEAMEHFEQRPCSLTDPIAAVARFPRLRTARFVMRQGIVLEITDRTTAAAGIETLVISLIPPGPWGFPNLATAVPRANRIELLADGPLTLDGDVAQTVQSLTVLCHYVDGHPRLPRELDDLSLRLRDGNDEQVIDLLEGVERVHALHLRGTPISDSFALSLPPRLRPEFLDLVDTGVSRDVVEQIKERFPDLRMLPNYAGRAHGNTPK
jgi:hypothetical protein